MAINTGAKIVFYASPAVQNHIRAICVRHPIDVEFQDFHDWDEFLILSRDIRRNDNLWIVLSHRDRPSYHPSMTKILVYLHKYFAGNSFVLVFPTPGDQTPENRYFI